MITIDHTCVSTHWKCVTGDGAHAWIVSPFHGWSKDEDAGHACHIAHTNDPRNGP